MMRLRGRAAETEQLAATAQTDDEIQAFLTGERKKLGELHSQRDRVQNSLADLLLDRRLGKPIDSALVVKLNGEQNEVDGQIEEQSAIVQRFEHRLWEFRESAAAAQHELDVDALERMTDEGDRLAATFDQQLRDLVATGHQLDRLRKEFMPIDRRARSYWSPRPDARKPSKPANAPITPYLPDATYLFVRRDRDIDQFIKHKVEDRARFR